MSADYNSTARALSLPIEAPKSPSPNLLRPPWNPPRRSSSTARSRSALLGHRRNSSLRATAIQNGEKIYRRIVSTVEKMTLLQRILAACALVVTGVLGILFLIFNEKIFTWLGPFAERWKDLPGGWAILWAMIFITAFPPAIGYGACSTAAGFIFGIWEGWLIIATASVVGSFCSLIVSRTILRSYVEKIVAHDKRFAALTLTLKHDGLKLLCMIRLCPLPYSLSNGAMATFPTVHPVMYALATAIVTPKSFVHVFIGSRLGVIARTGEKMSTAARVINWTSIAIGLLIGAFTGWYIYQKTMARAKQLEAEERANVRDSVQQSGAPPPEFTDDPDAQVAASTVANREDDAPDYFDEETSPRPENREYRDEFTDDEDADDVFGRGDGDEEEAIGLHRSKT